MRPERRDEALQASAMPPGFSEFPGIGATFLSVMLWSAGSGVVIGVGMAAALARFTANRRWWWLLPASVAAATLLGYALGNAFRWF